MSEYTECPKCGFTETPDGRHFKMSYQERCYSSALNTCTWADDDIREHLHVICPDCGFTVGAQGCNDYKKLKEEKTKKATPWTGVGTYNHVAAAQTALSRKFVQGKGYVDPPKEKFGGGWDTTECPQCPMVKGEKDAVDISELS